MGYFPLSDEALRESKTAWLEAMGQPTEGELPTVQPESVARDIATAGSSTVYPLSERMAQRFQEMLHGGYCRREHWQRRWFPAILRGPRHRVSNASRPIKRIEVELCRKQRERRSSALELTPWPLSSASRTSF